MPIDTLDNVKLQLGVTGTGDDDLLNLLRAEADGFIATHCGRAFDGGTFTEYHPSGRLVFLVNFPVAAVTSLRVDAARQFGTETEVDPSGYVIHANRGVIESVTGPFLPCCSPATVKVVYTTPTDAVPTDVSRAYAELISHWFRQTKTEGTLNHQNLVQRWDATGVVEVRYPDEQATGYPVPPGVLQLLQPYRMPSL